MAINVVFPNATVKKVIFQIIFPKFFSMENLIGQYQTKIMESFPESELIIGKHFLMANVPGDKNIIDISSEPKPDIISKIWRFKSEAGVILNIQDDSLDISSEIHKTYKNQREKIRFRDAIQNAVDNFLDVTSIPKINRIGIRYIDECPVPSKEHQQFKKYYNTALALNRFKIKDALRMDFFARVKRGKYFLSYKESLQNVDTKDIKLILDFDGFALNINASEYLKITDDLHKIISDEFFKKSIKEPVIKYMKKKKKMIKKKR